MPADPRVEQVLALLADITAADVAEDAAFQSQIDGLSTTLATITAERDSLAAERAVDIAELIAARDALTARIVALESR